MSFKSAAINPLLFPPSQQPPLTNGGLDGGEGEAVGSWPRLGKVPASSCRLVSAGPLWPDLWFQWAVRPNTRLQGWQFGALCGPWVWLLQPEENKTSQSPAFNYLAHNSEAPVLSPDQATSLCTLQLSVGCVRCAWGHVCLGHRPGNLS